MIMICSRYEGSVRSSGYPIIDVLKTTSPEASVGAPKPFPRRIVPSSRANTAARLSSTRSSSQRLLVFAGAFFKLSFSDDRPCPSGEFLRDASVDMFLAVQRTLTAVRHSGQYWYRAARPLYSADPEPLSVITST